jgi:hypothetical protein
MHPQELAKFRHAVVWAKRKGLISVTAPAQSLKPRAPLCLLDRKYHSWSGPADATCQVCGIQRQIIRGDAFYSQPIKKP